MSRAYLIKKRNRKKVVFTCDICGRLNVYDADKFIFAYIHGNIIHCKYCGVVESLVLDDRLEFMVKRRKSNEYKKRHKVRSSGVRVNS